MDINEEVVYHKNNSKPKQVVFFILGILEAFFVFRLIFKLLGANPESTFVSLIYSVSGVIMAPFSGIFRVAVNEGIETKSVLEPATMIAIIVYALIAYGIVKLIQIYQTRKIKEIRINTPR